MNDLLGKILTPLTTPTAGGTAFREILQAILVILAAVSTLGILPQSTLDWLNHAINAFLDPKVLAALSVLGWGALGIYRTLYKSRSVPGDEAAKQVDNIMAGEKKDAVVKTPGNLPDIKVAAKP